MIRIQTIASLQAIKLLGFEKGKKGKINLSFVVGDRILQYLQRCYENEKAFNLLLKWVIVRFTFVNFVLINLPLSNNEKIASSLISSLKHQKICSPLSYLGLDWDLAPPKELDHLFEENFNDIHSAISIAVAALLDRAPRRFNEVKVGKRFKAINKCGPAGWPQITVAGITNPVRLVPRVHSTGLSGDVYSSEVRQRAFSLLDWLGWSHKPQ